MARKARAIGLESPATTIALALQNATICGSHYEDREASRVQRHIERLEAAEPPTPTRARISAARNYDDDELSTDDDLNEVDDVLSDTSDDEDQDEDPTDDADELALNSPRAPNPARFRAALQPKTRTVTRPPVSASVRGSIAARSQRRQSQANTGHRSGARGFASEFAFDGDHRGL